MASQNKLKFSYFCDLEGGSRTIGDHVASFQLDLQLYNLVTNAHVIKCGEKKSWPMKLLNLVVELFSHNFFNELTIKCVVRFGEFVRISKNPWQLMLEIGLSCRYFIILLLCDNVLVLII
jgi:hypothetical protein